MNQWLYDSYGWDMVVILLRLLGLRSLVLLVGLDVSALLGVGRLSDQLVWIMWTVKGCWGVLIMHWSLLLNVIIMNPVCLWVVSRSFVTNVRYWL